MLQKASFRLAPRIRAGCLPEGEARGGDFALSELPHPSRGLFLAAKVTHYFDSATFFLNSLAISKNAGERWQ